MSHKRKTQIVTKERPETMVNEMGAFSPWLLPGFKDKSSEGKVSTKEKKWT